MSDFYQLVSSNEHFVVIYKKPNVNFHSENGEVGLFECVKQAEGLKELYPVHRLDKVTSGLLVMAKTLAANNELCAQFKARKIEKYYLAISAKKPKKKQGLIKGDMSSARRGAWKLLSSALNPAITQFLSVSIGDAKRLFIVKPHTGRTHQIRVALKSIGSPILGDYLYANSEACIDVDRTYLHSYSLAFTVAGEHYQFTELPREGKFFLSESFSAIMKSYHEPWALSWPQLS